MYKIFSKGRGWWSATGHKCVPVSSKGGKFCLGFVKGATNAVVIRTNREVPRFLEGEKSTCAINMADIVDFTYRNDFGKRLKKPVQ
jgi:hypothetical protein